MRNGWGHVRDAAVRVWPGVLGFLVTIQTIVIIRTGTLCADAGTCVAWPLATIGVQVVDLALAWFAYHGIRRLWSERPRGLLRASACLILLAVLNTWVSADPLLTVVGWVRGIAFLLALRGVPRTVEWRHAFVAGFVLALIGHAALGIVQFVTGEVTASTLLGVAPHAASVRGDAVVEALGGRWLRAYGGLPHPNILGTALLVGLMAIASLSSRFRLLPIFTFTILTSALLLTFSRAAWIGLVILLVVFVVRRATRSLAVAGAVTAAVVALAVAPLLIPRITRDGRLEERSVRERSRQVYFAVFGLIPPFLGVGLHASSATQVELYENFYEGAVLPPSEVFSIGQPIHDVPLLALAEIGIGGIALLALVLVSLFPRGPTFRWEHLALLPTILFDHHLWSLPVGLVFLLVLAVLGRTISATQSQS